MKIVTVIGARPQFVKAAMVSRAIQSHNQQVGTGNRIEELLLHTGQHYDENMSRIFFRDLAIPAPTWQLHCGNRTQGAMTGQMLIEIEQILLDTRPDRLLVYGDTNSTLAGALAATKLHIPVIHVEAGLRSFNRTMPEETNRILTDHVASLLCCPTQTAVENLKHEGITRGVYHVGDVMYDAALLFGRLADQRSTLLERLELQPRSFRLATVHRAENTDDATRLKGIMDALQEMATATMPLVLPLHPRTRAALVRFGMLDTLEHHPYIRLTEPLSFLDMVSLEKQAATILTDSGGVQKEAYFHHTPCITLRDETEWTETLTAGWNKLAGYHTGRILECLNTPYAKAPIADYGKGDAAGDIVRLITTKQ